MQPISNDIKISRCCRQVIDNKEDRILTKVPIQLIEIGKNIYAYMKHNTMYTKRSCWRRQQAQHFCKDLKKLFSTKKQEIHIIRCHGKRVLNQHSKDQLFLYHSVI